MAGSRTPRWNPDDPFATFAALGRAGVASWDVAQPRSGPRLVPPWLAAACGGDDDDDTSAAGGGTTQSSSDTLRISNWPLYIAEGFVDQFQDASGLTVDYKEDFNDNEQWFAKVRDPLEQGQDIGADLVVPTDFMAGPPDLTGLAESAQRREPPEQVQPAPRPAQGVYRPRAVLHPAVHVGDGRVGVQPPARRAGHHEHRRPVGSGVQGPGVAVLGQAGRTRHGHALPG